jgi:AcrR family transcriptional regulator
MAVMTETEPAPAQIGRPRDERIQEAVLSAARELLAEVGYQALTIAAISERSQTSKPAIYRRWPSKAHIVHEAVFPATLHMPAATDDLAADLRAVIRGAVELFATPAARAATPPLLGEMVAHPQLQEELTGRFRESVWRWLDERIEQAIADGTLRRGVDAQLLVETIVGSAVVAVAFRGPDVAVGPWADSLADQLLGGLLRPE